jgi:hypothetical protein
MTTETPRRSSRRRAAAIHRVPWRAKRCLGAAPAMPAQVTGALGIGAIQAGLAARAVDCAGAVPTAVRRSFGWTGRRGRRRARRAHLAGRRGAPYPGSWRPRYLMAARPRDETSTPRRSHAPPAGREAARGGDPVRGQPAAARLLARRVASALPTWRRDPAVDHPRGSEPRGAPALGAGADHLRRRRSWPRFELSCTGYISGRRVDTDRQLLLDRLRSPLGAPVIQAGTP